MYDNCCLVHWQTLFYPISANASLYCKDNTGRKSRWVVLSHTSLALAKTLTKRLYVWLNVEFMHAIQCFNSLLTCSMFNQDHNLSLILTKYEKHIILLLSFPFLSMLLGDLGLQKSWAGYRLDHSCVIQMNRAMSIFDSAVCRWLKYLSMVPVWPGSYRSSVMTQTFSCCMDLLALLWTMCCAEGGGLKVYEWPSTFSHHCHLILMLCLLS